MPRAAGSGEADVTIRRRHERYKDARRCLRALLRSERQRRVWVKPTDAHEVYATALSGWRHTDWKGFFENGSMPNAAVLRSAASQAWLSVVYTRSRIFSRPVGARRRLNAVRALVIPSAPMAWWNYSFPTAAYAGGLSNDEDRGRRRPASFSVEELKRASPGSKERTDRSS